MELHLHKSLTDGFGKMNKCKHEAVIRFRRYNKNTEPSKRYRGKLMLYYPWYDEHADLLGGYETYEEHYTHVRDTVLPKSLTSEDGSTLALHLRQAL